MNRITDLSLLVYLSAINNKDLPKITSKWSGCDESVYSETLQRNLYENTIIEITREHYIPDLFYHYFNIKSSKQNLARIFENMPYSEADVLKSTLHWIPIKIWSNEEREKLKELQKEYIDEKIGKNNE